MNLISLNVTLSPYPLNFTIFQGLDGEIIWRMLEDRGLRLSTLYPLFGQQLRNGRVNLRVSRPQVGAGENIKGGSHFLDFWMACEEGYVDAVKAYLESGVASVSRGE